MLYLMINLDKERLEKAITSGIDGIRHLESDVCTTQACEEELEKEKTILEMMLKAVEEGVSSEEFIAHDRT